MTKNDDIACPNLGHATWIQGPIRNKHEAIYIALLGIAMLRCRDARVCFYNVGTFSCSFLLIIDGLGLFRVHCINQSANSGI